MSNVVKITSNNGDLVINFDEKTIFFDRSGFKASNFGLMSVTINFADITDIEFWKPTLFLKCGCSIMIKNKRYTTPSNQDFMMFCVEKSNIQELQNALQRVINECGLSGFKALNASTAVKAYIMDEISEFETRKKCQSCGHLFCYSPIDMDINNRSASSARLDRTAGMFGALSGNIVSANVNNISAQINQSKIKDFNVCPMCNSRNLKILSKNEYEEEIKQKNAPAQNTTITALSPAEELKKFKELLDMGIITQEEFDAKKKQLLGL